MPAMSEQWQMLVVDDGGNSGRGWIMVDRSGAGRAGGNSSRSGSGGADGTGHGCGAADGAAAGGCGHNRKMTLIMTNDDRY